MASKYDRSVPKSKRVETSAALSALELHTPADMVMNGNFISDIIQQIEDDYYASFDNDNSKDASWTKGDVRDGIKAVKDSIKMAARRAPAKKEKGHTFNGSDCGSIVNAIDLAEEAATAWIGELNPRNKEDKVRISSLKKSLKSWSAIRSRIIDSWGSK